MARMVKDINLATGEVEYGEGGGGATVEVGTTTTLPAGSDATVTNSGTDTEVVLNFGIPQGAKGDTGNAGPAGADGATITGYEVKYQAGTSYNTPPSGTWSDSPPNVNAGNYLWTRVITTYSDNTSVTAYSVARQGHNAMYFLISSNTDTITKAVNGTLTPSSITFTSLSKSYPYSNSPIITALWWKLEYSTNGTSWTLIEHTSASTDTYTLNTGSLPSGVKFVRATTVRGSDPSAGMLAMVTLPVISDGNTGAGVPNGGTTGQFLVKNSNTDQDTKWAMPSPRLGYDTVNGVTYISIIED